MKRVAILFIILGMSLVGVSGVALAQQPGPPRPGDGRGDGRGHHHDGRGDEQNDTTDSTATTTESDTTAETVTTATGGSTDFVASADFFANPYLGGDNTVFDTSVEAFTNHLPGLTEAQILQFEEGDELFEQSFVAATGIVAEADGLGPVFNADSCESCHVSDGRGRAPLFTGEMESGFLIRLASEERTLNGATLPDPIYGGQLQDGSIAGMSPEASIVITYRDINGTFADGTPYTLRQPVYTLENMAYGPLADGITFSPRVANQMIGLGLLEAIDEATILSFADPNDSNGDGISGRPNYVWDEYNNQTAIGRFGWKANQPNLIQQTAGAYNGDMGISTSLFPHQPCTEAQTNCATLPTGGAPEVSDEHVLLVAFYSSTLSVPAQRNYNDSQVQRGEQIFNEAQCSACHVSQVTTGLHTSIPQLSNQTIRPFTDLLLHDMGENLADGQSDFQATGSEWRTPPLWGIGLIETINGHTTYLHDGRARDLTEAILWHGGEGSASRDYFLTMSAEDREALLAFLRSL